MSKSNVSLLENFAFSKLANVWPSHKKELKEAISFTLENILDSYVVPTWSLNEDTLSDVNVQVWRILRPKLEITMNSRLLEPEVKLYERNFFAEKRENNSLERY
jgi:hypothetical protein